MNDQQGLNQVERLIKEGRIDEAYRMIKEYINQNPYDIKGWQLIARLSSNPDEKKFAIEQALAVDPDNEWANKMSAHINDEKDLQQAVSSARDGRVEEANKLVDKVLSINPENPEAWYVKARLTKDRDKAVQALNQVLSLAPEDQRAHQQLERLQPIVEENSKPERKPAFSRLGILLAVLLLGVTCVAVAIPLFQDNATSQLLETVSGVEAQSCRELIERAMQISDSSCQKIGGNQVCYGNYNLYAQMAPGFEEQFDLVGDVVPINNLSKLVAAPLNLEENLWGVAILKVPANLEGTLPGQNVTFMVFGDTSIDNTSGDMSAFYFSSGITGITCDEVAFDGLFIETEDGAGISFRANGVDFVLEGDAVLEAQPGGELTVTMLEGSGTVSADGVTQDIGTGNSVSIPVDEDLEASGPPSGQEPIEDDKVALECEITGWPCPTEVPATPVAAATDQPTNTPVPGTPGEPTNTPVPVATSTTTPSSTPTKTLAPGEPSPTSAPATATYTPSPSNTTAPTSTIALALTSTNTPIPTSTITPIPTNTNTPIPTNTNTPVPTSTNTPVPGTCSLVTVAPGAGTGTFTITNNNAVDLNLVEVTLTWPDGLNGKLTKILLDGTSIANPPGATTSPITVDLRGYPAKKVIYAGSFKVLSFEYAAGPNPGYYAVTLKFDIAGCTPSASNTW